MRIRDFRDLTVWQKAVDLAADVYTITRAFPKEERFGLTSQLRKATVSVSSNIAEGNGRGTMKDYVSFLHVSTGSLNEARSLLAVSSRLEFLPEVELIRLDEPVEEISKMLAGLRMSLQRRSR